MNPSGRRSFFLPWFVRDIPDDLAIVVSFVLLADIFAISPLHGSVLLAVLAIAIVLFCPGYVFISAVFPEASDSTRGRLTSTEDATISWTAPGPVERAILSFGSSIVLSPVLGIVLVLSPWPVRRSSLLLVLTVFILGVAIIAARRRSALPPEDQFQIRFNVYLENTADRLSTDSHRQTVKRVLFGFVVVLAVSTTVYAITAPSPNEPYTGFYLLNIDENGTESAKNYDTELSVGSTEEYVVVVENHEQKRLEYTVVAALQRIQRQNGTVSVQETTTLERARETVDSNDTWSYRHRFTPSATGEQLRLVYFLYRPDISEKHTSENAYRALRLNINVTR